MQHSLTESHANTDESQDRKATRSRAATKPVQSRPDLFKRLPFCGTPCRQAESRRVGDKLLLANGFLKVHRIELKRSKSFSPMPSHLPCRVILIACLVAGTFFPTFALGITADKLSPYSYEDTKRLVELVEEAAALVE